MQRTLTSSSSDAVIFHPIQIRIFHEKVGSMEEIFSWGSMHRSASLKVKISSQLSIFL